MNKSDEAKIAALCSKYGVRRAKNLQDLVRSSETVILAVKPSQVPEVLEELSAGAAVPPGVELSEPSVSRSRLLVSVAAGVPLEYLESALEHEFAVIRSMPNIPAQVGRGVMAATPGKGVTEKQKLAAERILGSTGKVFWVSEDDLDSVTALSGSGPAYFFRLAEDMAVAGAKLGLDPSLSEELARQTLAGAGALVAEKPVPLSQLVRDVTSPNGTTAAAMSVFDGRRLDLLVEEAMAHAAARSREMAQARRHSISGAASSCENRVLHGHRRNGRTQPSRPRGSGPADSGAHVVRPRGDHRVVRSCRRRAGQDGRLRRGIHRGQTGTVGRRPSSSDADLRDPLWRTRYFHRPGAPDEG